MARIAQKDKARKIYEEFDRYRSQRLEWLRAAAADMDYYYGKQWSEDEVQELQARGKAPLVFNIIKPQVDTKVSIMTSSSPGWKVLPRGDEDRYIANVWNDVLNYIWYNSHGLMELKASVLNYCRVGLGWMQVDIDPFADLNRGEVIVNDIAHQYVYVDPESRKFDFSDARKIFVSKRIPRSTAKMLYPDKVKQINKAEADNDNDFAMSENYDGQQLVITPTDYDFFDRTGQDKIRIIEQYEMVYKDFYAIYMLDDVSPIFMTKEEYETTELAPGFELDEVKLKRCRRIITIGQSIVISDEILPISDFPIIPMVNVHTNTPYPHGDIRGMRDMQDEKNKRRMVIIHSAMASATGRVMAARGTVEADIWEKKAGIPAAVLEYEAIPGIKEPVPFPNDQLPAHLFVMEENSRADAEYFNGVYPTMMGNAADSPDTYRATLMMEETGTRRIRGMDMSVIEHSLGRLGRVALEFAQSLYTDVKVMRVVGEDKEMQQIVVNEPAFDAETGMITRRYNDLSIGQFDVVCVGGSTMPTNRIALAEMFENWFQMGLVDDQAVLYKAGIADADKILARKGQMAQLTQMVEKDQESIKELNGMIQTLKKMLTQQEIRITDKEFELMKRAELIALEAEARVQKVLMRANTENFNKELAMAKKMANTAMNERLNAAMNMSKAALRVANERAKNRSEGKAGKSSE